MVFLLRAFWLSWGADKVVRVGSGRGGLGCVAAEVYACLDGAEFVFVVFFGQIKVAFEAAGGKGEGEQG